MGLFDVFSSSPGKRAANQAERALVNAAKKGFSKASGYVTGGRDEAYGFLDEARAPWSNLYNRSLAGWDAYADAAGLNGPEGYERALASFRTNPGYQFTIDQALQAINRNAAATGRLASGNTDIDVANYVTGLADQQWNDYVARLIPFLEGAYQAASGETGVLTNKADVATGAARALADLVTGKYNAIGQAQANAAQQRAAAEYGSSANIWNALMGGAEFIAKAAGWGGFGA